MSKKRNKGGKGGNPYHKGKGRPDGGQFTSGKESDYSIRIEPIKNDIEKHLEIINKNNINENVNNALYDGGYLTGKKQSHSLEKEESKLFFDNITKEEKSTEVWKNHKDLIDNYVGVAKGYLSNQMFDLVLDGKYSNGKIRYAQEIMDEFNLNKEKVSNLLIDNLKSEDFVSSGKNNSGDSCNKGTVVMVFAPTVKMEKNVITSSGNVIRKSEKVNLYVKMVLNPHPNTKRKQTEFQVLSFREAKNKTCIFTGKTKTMRGRNEKS